MSADARGLARELVAEITETVHRRYQPRRGELVPPRLKGSFAVPNAKVGETVMDLADDLLATACADWPLATEPDVFLELTAGPGGVAIEWIVDSAGEADDEAPG